MSVRIERIEVKPGGPLEQPLDWYCGDLTVAYGGNETGKSYVVEFLVRCLFRTGARKGSGWSLRDLPGGGSVTLSGTQDKPVKMSVSKRPKLDEVWEEDPRGLPQDLCRLLVVTQGNSRLSVAESSDGIDDSMLRDFFSGEHLIESIRNSKALPKSAATASLEAGTISGSGQWSDKAQRESVLDQIQAVEELLGRFNDQISHGAIASLTVNRDRLVEQLGQLQAGRQQHANRLDQQLTSRTGQLAALPSTEEIESVSADLRTLRRIRIESDTKRERHQELARQQDHLEWTTSALEHYDRIVSARPQPAATPWLAIAAVGVLIAAVIAGLLEQRLALGVLALVASGLAAAHLWRTRQPQLPEPDDPVELERIGSEFQRRFDQPLGDRASLEQKIEALKKLGNEAEVLEAQLGTETGLARSEADRIGRLLTGWAKDDLPETDWDSLIESTRNQRQVLDQQIRDTQSKLDRLGVAPLRDADGPPDQPDQEWDPEHYDRLLEQHRQAEAELNEETQAQSQLLEDAHRSADESAAADWESLLAGMESRMADLQKQYRNTTARMIAQFAVHTVLEQVGLEEARMIEEGLQSAAIGESIRLMCPRYQSLRSTEEGLVVTDGDDNEFAVKDLSTGAREQVFLGARLGFARRALDDVPAFLVLDDAFQHSDWTRRERLVKEVLTLVEAGWQVLYFTMDDHIRDLFHTAGQTLGKRFVSYDLPQPNSSLDR